MASEENQEQPAANHTSSNAEEQESLEQQDYFVDRADNLTVNAEDTREVNNKESLTEEVIQVQPEIIEKDSKLISSVSQSSSKIVDKEEKIELTSSQVATEVVANPLQQDENKNWWDVILDEIRSFLPESMNKSLSDWALTAIVSSLIVLILSISVILLPSRASSDPLSDSSKTVSIPQPEIEITINSASTEEQETTETLSDSSKTVSTPVEIDTPETLGTPKKPASLTVQTPPPQPVLTPEQNLWSAVQEKVSQITNQYADKAYKPLRSTQGEAPSELIVSGEADLLSHRLLIKVNDDWYKLNKSRQDEFANEILKRSQKFKFNKLEIQDAQNNIIARSPVVGNKMIILRGVQAPDKE